MWHMPCAERWAGWFSQKSWLWKSAWWYDNCGPGLSSDLVLDPQTERCWVHAIPRMSCQNPLGPIFLAMQNALLGPQVGRGLASSHFHATSVRPGERGDAEFVWSLKWQHVRKLSYNVEHGNTRFRPWIVQVNMANFCNFGVPSKEKRGLLVGTVWCYGSKLWVKRPLEWIGRFWSMLGMLHVWDAIDCTIELTKILLELERFQTRSWFKLLVHWRLDSWCIFDTWFVN